MEADLRHSLFWYPVRCLEGSSAARGAGRGWEARGHFRDHFSLRDSPPEGL